MAAGARCKQVEVVLDEIAAVRHALSRANKGDLLVICVDKHPAVMSELEGWSNVAQAGSAENPDAPAWKLDNLGRPKVRTIPADETPSDIFVDVIARHGLDAPEVESIRAANKVVDGALAERVK